MTLIDVYLIDVYLAPYVPARHRLLPRENGRAGRTAVSKGGAIAAEGRTCATRNAAMRTRERFLDLPCRTLVPWRRRFAT